MPNSKLTLVSRAIHKAKARGLSVSDIAQKTGVTSATVYNWINGGNCSALNTAKLLKGLNLLNREEFNSLISYETLKSSLSATDIRTTFEFDQQWKEIEAYSDQDLFYGLAPEFEHVRFITLWGKRLLEAAIAGQCSSELVFIPHDSTTSKFLSKDQYDTELAEIRDELLEHTMGSEVSDWQEAADLLEHPSYTLSGEERAYLVKARSNQENQTFAVFEVVWDGAERDVNDQKDSIQWLFEWLSDRDGQLFKSQFQSAIRHSIESGKKKVPLRFIALEADIEPGDPSFDPFDRYLNVSEAYLFDPLRVIQDVLVDDEGDRRFATHANENAKGLLEIPHNLESLSWMFKQLGYRSVIKRNVDAKIGACEIELTWK